MKAAPPCLLPQWLVHGIITPNPPEELTTDDEIALTTDDGQVLDADS